jgi:hypothetical protein
MGWLGFTLLMACNIREFPTAVSIYICTKSNGISMHHVHIAFTGKGHGKVAVIIH